MAAANKKKSLAAAAARISMSASQRFSISAFEPPRRRDCVAGVIVFIETA
jgi:hypothetical protein